MNESEANKCLQCGGEMEQGDYLKGYHWTEVRLIKYDDFYGIFYCKNCGFIRLYKEVKKKD